MRTLIHDCRYGLRSLSKSPGLTFVAVVTLALGIGANTTVYSRINSTLLDPIPGIHHTSDLVVFVRGERTDNPTPPCSYPDYADLCDQNRSFSGLLAFHDDWMSIPGERQPQRVYGAVASANYFEVLGVRPILGRGFLPEEEKKPGGAPVVVISHSLWQSRYAGDRAVLGKVIEINRNPAADLEAANEGSAKSTEATDGCFAPAGQATSAEWASRPADGGHTQGGNCPDGPPRLPFPGG